MPCEEDGHGKPYPRRLCVDCTILREKLVVSMAPTFYALSVGFVDEHGTHGAENLAAGAIVEASELLVIAMQQGPNSDSDLRKEPK